jgi:hypothetical protein
MKIETNNNIVERETAYIKKPREHLQKAWQYANVSKVINY